VARSVNQTHETTTTTTTTTTTIIIIIIITAALPGGFIRALYKNR
jgi:hypothetical protein